MLVENDFSGSLDLLPDRQEFLCPAREVFFHCVASWLWGTSRFHFGSNPLVTVRVSIGVHFQETQNCFSLFSDDLLLSIYPNKQSEFLLPYSPPRALQPSDQQVLNIPRAKLKARCGRAFSVVAPSLWNSLPLQLRAAQNLNHFKTLLKSHLCPSAFNFS